MPSIVQLDACGDAGRPQLCLAFTRRVTRRHTGRARLLGSRDGPPIARRRAPGSSGSVVIVVRGLEVVVVEVARDGGPELDALTVGGAEVDPGPDPGVDVLLQRV